jgi:hypothetical protein
MILNNIMFDINVKLKLSKTNEELIRIAAIPNRAEVIYFNFG